MVAPVYTDLHALGALKTEAKEQTPAAIREVARQFESLFMGIMLKGMREATPDDGLFSGGEVRFCQDMYDQQLSVTLGNQGALGIADMLERALATRQAGSDVTAAMPNAPAGNAASTAPGHAVVPGARTAANAAAAPTAPDPAAFVRSILPLAEQAGAQLGVHPHALVAQAALETGWGARPCRGANGEPSHNLFNLKATGGWKGERVSVATLEFSGGVPARKVAAFRAYGSPAESFEDYARLVGNHPRYAAARQQGADPVKYAEALQAAGYATDPGYARKIAHILGSETFRSAVQGAGSPVLPVLHGTAAPSAAAAASSLRPAGVLSDV
jgi:peptidoglycan hydrolase FlgJ